MRRQVFALMVGFFACVPAFADDTSTSPQTIVNVEITPSSNGEEMTFSGALLYFDTVQSFYYEESQRDRPDLANRTQDVTILQSKLVRFNVHRLKFRSIAGEDLDINEVKTRLKKNPLALMLPVDASIHPQLAAAFNPDTIIVTRDVSRSTPRSTPQRLVPSPGNE